MWYDKLEVRVFWALINDEERQVTYRISNILFGFTDEDDKKQWNNKSISEKESVIEKELDNQFEEIKTPDQNRYTIFDYGLENEGGKPKESITVGFTMSMGEPIISN